MQNMELLKARGVSSGAYKKIFTAEPSEYPAKIKKLVDLISARISDGRRMNLQEHRAYAAVDMAYDVPFNQTTPTLINNILSKNLNAEDTIAHLRAWGLREEDLFLKVPIEGGTKGTGLILNPPVFFQIFIPIVKAYVTIRLAKLFNERNVDGAEDYVPIRQTARNQVYCEIISDISSTMAGWYGYSAVKRQAIQQMLKYGISLAFTREEWHYEDQLVGVDEKSGRDVYRTVKEGLRYILPHPTRMFYDMMYPLTSVNSDTGCQFAGHWQVMRYGDVLDNPMYWNRRSIFTGTDWFSHELAGNFFKEVYPCTLRLPTVSASGPSSREERAATYTSGDRDQAVFVTPFFMKLNPREWGLGEYVGNRLHRTYDRPIWHKFILAGDDTVIWAEPCAYNPMWFMGYDYDEQAGRTSSLALEAIPWQDHVGNILSQIILTAQQNLANFTFYDTNIVNKDDIDRAKNLGSRLYRGMNFVGFDSTLNQRLGIDVKAAFIPAQLEKQSIVELQSMLATVLPMMERVMQISAQEAGAPASHQQSKFELQQLAGSSSNRVIFTGSYVDEGIDAWKKQRIDAAKAYRDPTVSAEVSADIPELERHLQEIGFEPRGFGLNRRNGKKTVLVSGNINSIRMEGFASSKSMPDRGQEKEISQIIFQTVAAVANNQALAASVGAQNLLVLLEQGAKMAGAPRDFQLRSLPAGSSDSDIPPHIVQAIQQAQAATLKAVQENLAKPIAQEIAQDQQSIEQLSEVIAKLQGIYQIAAQTQDKNAIKAKETQARLQLKAQESQAANERKAQETQASIQREAAKTQAEIQNMAAKTEAETHIRTAEAAHASALEAHAAAHAPKPEKAE